MSYGLLLKNKDGDVVLNTTSNVLNSEVVSATSVVVAANSTSSVTIPDVHIPAAVVVDLIGGDPDITTTTSTDTLIVANASGAERTLLIETWRLL